ncbi:hypothetical protein [Chryseobacterium daeguense]|uniref:hypothetical protein n=1 Tax=Chryseobacterium daeguense TaxID=412438 RepID=UPI0003F97551|nr:hypothetical protein [Chryseobacterium daeguense]
MKKVYYIIGDKFKYSGLEFEITNITEDKVVFRSLRKKGVIDCMEIKDFETLFKNKRAEFIRNYGALPTVIREIEIDCKEMMFYQYLPIKLKGMTGFVLEERLMKFSELIVETLSNYKNTFGEEKFNESYIYLTVKRQYVSKKKSMNRPGYHSDGFMTDDINYIWSDRNPTIFNVSNFNLTLDDEISLKEMKKQALPENEITYPENTILRLNQYNIHKVNDSSIYEGIRTFVKISFSNDKYDLEGNSHNYELDYNWKMKPRQNKRNIPQTKIQKV